MSKQQQILATFQMAINTRKAGCTLTATPCLDESYIPCSFVANARTKTSPFNDDSFQPDDDLELMLGLNDDLDQERRRYQKRTWSDRVECRSDDHYYMSSTSDDSQSWSVSHGPQSKQLCQQWSETTLASNYKSIDFSSTDNPATNHNNNSDNNKDIINNSSDNDDEVLYEVLATKEAELRENTRTTIKTAQINALAILESQKYRSLLQSAVGGRVTKQTHAMTLKWKEPRYCSVTSWLQRM